MEIQLPKINLQGLQVLLRLDLDVPILPNGQVGELARLQAALPSLKYCLNHASKTLILGHLGRPQGHQPQLSLRPVAKTVGELLGRDISFLEDMDQAHDWHKSTIQVGLLENLRFWPGESTNDRQFAQQLTQLGNFYVNDAFAASHRSDASIVSLPRLLPSAIGFQMIKEVEGLQKAFSCPKRPVVMLLGGIKADKLEFVDNFLEFVDNLLIGGRLVDHSPDHPKIIKAKLTPDNLDISQTSIDLFSTIIAKAGTIIWNGPVGQFENSEHAHGTHTLAQAIADSPAFTIVGGGDTLAAIHQYGLTTKYNHVSLGGGAMLYFLAKHTLPGLEAID